MNDESYSLANVMELFIRFNSKFQNMSKKNVSREFEPELNQLQQRMNTFFFDLDTFFFRVPQEWREGK